MALVEIMVRFTPLGGGRRVTQQVLTEVDTSLRKDRIGIIVGRAVETAVIRALGFDQLGHHRVELANGLVFPRVSFDGIYTVHEDKLGRTGLVDYVRLTEHGREKSVTHNVRVSNIVRVVVLPH